jgi:F420-dependent oxidoreductase-like protein
MSTSSFAQYRADGVAFVGRAPRSDGTQQDPVLTCGRPHAVPPESIVKVGLQFPSYSWPGGDAAIGATLARITEAADAAAVDSLWLNDHFWQVPHIGRVDEPVLETWTALGYMAAHSTGPTLGVLVGGIHYRQAGLLAKAATTLDVLSGGRACFGIGAGWYEEESRGLGFPMPPLGTRFEMVEETLRICLEMWKGERGSEAAFQGKHYQATRLLNSPQSISRPHPRIMVGGEGERKTLRLVAMYADSCNLNGDPAELTRKFGILRERCAEVGRPFEEIERTTLQTVDLGRETPSQVVDRFGRLADVGVQHVIVTLADAWDVRNIDALGRAVVPQLHAIGPQAI